LGCGPQRIWYHLVPRAFAQVREWGFSKIEAEREQDAQNGVAFAQNLKREIEDLEKRLDLLLDTHLDGLIPKVEYAEKKQKILNRKIEVSEKLKDFE